MGRTGQLPHHHLNLIVDTDCIALWNNDNKITPLITVEFRSKHLCKRLLPLHSTLPALSGERNLPGIINVILNISVVTEEN